MTQFYRQWTSKNGHRKTRWGCETSGVIEETISWIAECSGGLSFGKAVFYGEYCYVYSDDHTVYSFNIDDGTQKWGKKIARNAPSGMDMCVSDSGLIIDSIVFDFETGELSIDLNDLIEGIEIKAGSYMDVVDDHLIKMINLSKVPGQIIDYNLKNGEVAFLNFDTLSFCFVKSDKAVIGWRKLDSGHSLVCLSWPEGNVLWENLALLPCRLVSCGNYVALIGQSGLSVVESNNGEVLYSMALEDISSEINVSSIGQYMLLLCDDTVSISTFEDITTLEIGTGQKLWSKPLKRIQDACIAGDIIYGIYQDDTIIALDRYTGEELLSFKGSKTLGSVKSNGNKIFFTDVRGALMCYEWLEPYSSPAKP